MPRLLLGMEVGIFASPLCGFKIEVHDCFFQKSVSLQKAGGPACFSDVVPDIDGEHLGG